MPSNEPLAAPPELLEELPEEDAEELEELDPEALLELPPDLLELPQPVRAMVPTAPAAMRMFMPLRINPAFRGCLNAPASTVDTVM
ncbi:hypothetical protein [Allobranchiibius sp. CTAmp26]|uniref:hypothetical protein n=1 Tax=Allobranchiibius sp. CTAmp26 TaxID=2815214 RepID=UPI001AA1BC2C|nr:hypothetical protein [Allobranchiibius sp. CTAmp26]MBO1754862.1 hypothetical protein [Allobranchiibius sp. CTAmp26]